MRSCIYQDTGSGEESVQVIQPLEIARRAEEAMGPWLTHSVPVCFDRR